MNDTDQSIDRYTTGDLRERLFAALRASGKEPGVLLPGDLAEADHFHSGGMACTAEVAAALEIGLGSRVLDVGSGIGGPARFFARLGAVVTGVDVTEEFVALARELNAGSLLAGSVVMLQVPGADTGLPGGSFDVATLLHVGMNLAKKQAVFAEVHRLLRPGGVFGVYDLMGTNQLTYPMPWADGPGSSYVQDVADYRHFLQATGFTIIGDVDHSRRALELMKAQGLAQRTTPSPLGAPILLGRDPVDRIGNVVAAIASGDLAARLLIAKR